MSTLAPLPHLKQLDIKDERCIRWNCARRTPLAIAKAWRNDQPALSTDTHALHPFIPALDHLAAAQRKLERVTSITRAIDSRFCTPDAFAPVRSSYLHDALALAIVHRCLPESVCVVVKTVVRSPSTAVGG